MLLTLSIAFTLATTDCVVVGGDRILAGDLVAAVPELGALPAETVLGFAPLPGARRIFPAGELKRLAERADVKITPANGVCIERQLQTITAESILTEIKKSPRVKDCTIEVLDFPHVRAPEGEMVFPPEALMNPPTDKEDAPTLWRGYIRFGGGRRFSIWAKVKVTGPMQRVVAVEDLKARQPIQANQVKLEEYSGFPRTDGHADTLDRVVGRCPRRAIPSGASIHPAALDEPPAVSRGDLVDLEVRSGATHLDYVARAESSGRAGQTVSLRNAESKKIFPARVEGKGKALIVAKPETAATSAEGGKR
jgi:flagella basal body P-ring formation protein FlgA